MKTVTSVEAQNHFGVLLDNAQRVPITITRRGWPVGVILSARDMEEMTAVRGQLKIALQLTQRFLPFFARLVVP